MDNELPVIKLCRDISYRLQMYGHRKLPLLIPQPGIKEHLREARKRDEEGNAKTEPSSDELIDLRCIWAVEFYTPSHIGQLFRSFEKLGWDREDHFMGSSSPTLWLQRFRETSQGGGLFNLGPIHSPGNKRSYLRYRMAPIPPHVDYALASMFSLTSSITCIVLCFILNENCSGRFEEVLRRKRKTVFKALLNGGYRICDPEYQKKEDIKDIRTEMRTSAANWFRTQLPGLFASGIMGDEFPSCEFVTLRKTIPFPNSDEVEQEPKDWLSILNMDRDFDVWLAEEPQGLKFAWPLRYDEKNRFHSVIAVKEDILLNLDLRLYGYNRRSYAYYVNKHVVTLLSRWAILSMLSGFERSLNNIRDSATFKPIQKERPLYLLRELIEHVSQSVDITAVSTELRHFAEQTSYFEREVGTFKASDRKFYPNEKMTLTWVLQQQINKRSEWLENMDKSIRSLLIQYGMVIGTHENIKLQKHMSKLTWVMLILTILITGLTMLTAYVTKPEYFYWLW